jgi:hypothetical protein
MKIISTSIYDVAVVIELVQLLKMSGKHSEIIEANIEQQVAQNYEL